MVDFLIVAAYVLYGIYWILKKEKIGNIKIKTNHYIKLIKLLMLFMPPLALLIRMETATWENLIRVSLLYISFLIMHYIKAILMQHNILSVDEDGQRRELEKRLDKEVSDAKFVLLIGSVPAFIFIIAAFLPQ